MPIFALNLYKFTPAKKNLHGYTRGARDKYQVWQKLESGKRKIVKRVQRYSKSSKEFKDIGKYWKDTQPNKWNLESWKGKIVKSKKNQRYWKHAKPIIKTVGGGNQSKVFKVIGKPLL